MKLVYFSSASGNTQRFVAKLGDVALDCVQIPVHASAETPRIDQPFILMTPTYGGGSRRGADVPKQVVRFLNIRENRDLLRGVIAAGNTNFGADYCRAGDVIAEKCGVPVLHRFELLGNPEDVMTVTTIMEQANT